MLRILELALADVNHHLSLVQLYNQTADFDANAYQEYTDRLSKEVESARGRYFTVYDKLEQQQQEHAQKISQQKDALRKVLDENRKMKIAKEQIDK